MELSEWIRQFFQEKRFEAQAEQAEKPFLRHPSEPHWPNGTDIDPLKPYWVENTEKTYETLDAAVDDMGGQIPSSISFGLVKFD